MIGRVRSARNRFPLSMYLHKSLEKSEVLKSKIPSVPPNQRPAIIFQYCRLLVEGGKIHEAVRELEALRASINQTQGGVSAQNKPIYDLLAVAYLRMGEVENCCSNHNEESCLFPIKGKAIHTRKTGSQKAIEVYKEILAVFPKDIQTQYLMNVAYMTLGEYPHNVPNQYLLKGLGKPSEVEFPEFKDIAIATGADVEGLSGGLSLEDFNGDGWLDILCSSYGLDDQVKYLENDGAGSFINKTENSGLVGVVSGLNMIHADYDNDGDQDVLLLRGAWLGRVGNHPNSLLRNNGDGTFEDVAISSGIFSEHPTQTAVWADFDNDGHLDLFIGNEHNPKDQNNDHPCELFMNQGNGKFLNQADIAGVTVRSYVKGCTAGDFDQDGLIDLYVSVLDGENILFRNKGRTPSGVPQFENVAQKAGVIGPISSFPCWFFDYNNDGFQDLFVADYDLKSASSLAGEMALELIGKKSKLPGAKLYRNNGDGTFKDVSKKAGLDRPMFAMGANFGDLNNDGFLDFYIGNGSPDFRSIVPNLMFLNEEGKSFIDVTVNGRFGNLQKGHAIAFGDIDDDGDQDIYAVMGGAVTGDHYQNVLFQNPGWSNKWLSLDLEGVTSNRGALGAKVEVITIDSAGNENHFHRTVGTGGSFGASSMRMEIGLGEATSVEKLIVTWPNRAHQIEEFSEVELNSHFKIKEGTGTVESVRSSS